MAGDPQQEEINRKAMIGISISGVLIGSLWWLNPFPCPPASAGDVEIMKLTVRWLLPLPFSLLYLIQMIASKRRLSKAKNPLGEKDNELVVLPNKMLQNTIEQGLFFIINLLMLSTYITPTFYPLIPALAINFLVSRVAFFWGYQHQNNLNRAYGFAMTFVMNVVLLAVVTMLFVKNMILGM